MVLCCSDLLLALISKNIFRTILDHAPFAIEDLIRELQQGGVDDSDSGQASGEEEEELKNQVHKKTKVKKVNGGWIKLLSTTICYLAFGFQPSAM